MNNYVIKKIDKGYVKFDANKKMTITSNRVLAEQFSYDAAISYIKNCISNKTKKLFCVESGWDDSLHSQPKESKNSRYVPHVTVFADSDFNWLEYCEFLQNFLSDAQKHKENLSAESSDIDKERCDVDHYIEKRLRENKKFNAVEMCKYFKQICEILTRRRDIKDEIQKTDIIISANLEDFLSGSVLQRLKKLDSRIYTPRILNNLFDS